MKKIRYIIIAMVLPIITMASDICEDGVKKYYEKDFNASSMLLQTCIEDKSSLSANKDKAKFYITQMVLYKNINETQKTLQYMEELLQTQNRYVSYLEAILEWSKRNYEESAKYYRSVLDAYLFSNQNQKIKPLHQIKTDIHTIITTAKGTPKSIKVSAVALNYQNIDKVKDKVIKFLLSRIVEELETKPKVFIYDDREVDKNIVFLDFSINGGKTIKISEEIKSSNKNTLASVYTLAQEYLKNQDYKTAMIYFKHIVDDIFYQEIYDRHKKIETSKPKKITTVSVEKKLIDLKQNYLIKLDVSFEATQTIDKKYLEKTLNDILDTRSRYELQTVGGMAMFKEELIEKIDKDYKENIVKKIYILSYDLKKLPWKMKNDITVKPKKISKIVNFDDYNNYLLNDNTIQAFSIYSDKILREYKVDENSVYIMTAGKYFVANNIGEIKKINYKDVKPIIKGDGEPIINMAFLYKGFKYLIVTNKDTILIYNIKHKENKLVHKQQISNNSIGKIISEKSSSKIYYFTNDYGYKYLRYALAYIEPADKNSTIKIAYKNDTMISDATINEKSNIIAIADYNGKIKTIDKKSFQLKDTLTFDNKKRKSTKISLSSDGKNILAIYGKKDIVLWDLDTKNIKYKIKNDNLKVTSFDINRDTIKIAFDDGTIRIFNRDDGKYLARFYPFENKQSILIYKDGTYKATKDIDNYCDVSIEPYDKYLKFTNNKPRFKATTYKGYDLSKIALIPLDILQKLDDEGFKLDLDRWYKTRTPLMDAISKNDYIRVKWLLSHGANTILKYSPYDPSPWYYFDHTKDNTKIYKLLENKPFAQMDRYNAAFCHKFVGKLYDKNYQKNCEEAVRIYKKKIDMQSIKYLFLAGGYKKILKLSIDKKKNYLKWVKEYYWKYLGYSYYIEGDYLKTKECFIKLQELQYKTKEEYKKYFLKDTILIQKLYDKDIDKLNSMIEFL